MDPVDRIAEIARQHSDETEKLRHLHPEVVRVLVDTGVLRSLVAQAYGGAEQPILEVLKLIEKVSQADGSTGWCTMIASTTGLTSHSLRADWAQTIYGDPEACTGGFGMPIGTAQLVDGGLEVTGRWAWGSGTDHCSWIGGGVHVVDAEGQRAKTGDGASAPFVFFDLSNVELLDTWHVSGLKGTASTDYAVHRAFVPEGRWAQLIGGRPIVDSAASRFPFFGALAAGVASVTLGLAERAIEELIRIGDKKSAGSSKTLAERAPVQADLAQATANIGQARSFLYEKVEDAWSMALTGDPPTDACRASLRLAATSAGWRAVEAVDLCYHAAGGSAVYEASPLQRVFRDAHVACAHG
ncbi:hypothetical protein MK280_05025, partial [Myxococcota bacterium]|nr:hypothetical protein [Myxococcota bacterium]